MDLLPNIDDFCTLQWPSFRILLTCLTLAVISVGLYAYFFLKTVLASDEVAVRANWEMYGSIYRIVDYFVGIVKGRGVAERGGNNEIVPAAVKIPHDGEICYTDLLNPYKYVTPRVKPLRMI